MQLASKHPLLSVTGITELEWTTSKGSHRRWPPTRSCPSTQSIGRSSRRAFPEARGKRSTAATRHSAWSSAILPKRSGNDTCSACQVSIASMSPETVAAAHTIPQPGEPLAGLVGEYEAHVAGGVGAAPVDHRRRGDACALHQAARGGGAVEAERRDVQQQRPAAMRRHDVEPGVEPGID